MNALRELTKIAARGDISKSTYANALELGGELYPELLGPDVSVLRREREGDIAKEYRQKARLKSIKSGFDISPSNLIGQDIDDIKDLLEVAKREKSERTKVDQLKRRLKTLIDAEREINPVAHSENQLIFRDALAVNREIPALGSGKAYRDFRLPDDSVLRVRVLHPDKPEHITGADIIYERHSRYEEGASIVAIQYKIWEDKTMYLSDERMANQLTRLKNFTCDRTICSQSQGGNTYRFPCCAGFLRPTDKLQRADQSFISTGEHLPICKIDECKTLTARGAELLEYSKIRDISLSGEIFEQLFNTGKIGSRLLAYAELQSLYEEHAIVSEGDTVIIYAQEFSDQPRERIV
ncbi:hypothetical protein [Paraburkholderia bannensis]|uniref:hypothetical protein n=1 Tax=Paraburkholderia bannensis TaxID=765414 RepID=UPI002AB6FADA|nr:hypothetical protein [Paraburkholderia bannensis]